MQRNLIDITFTVRPAEAQGRRLFRDLNTGQILWEPVEPLPEASVEQSSADPAPAPTKTTRKSRKKNVA